MLEDDVAPSPEQRMQMQAGAQLAMRCAIAALIESHPSPAAFEAKFDSYLAMTDEMLLLRTALTALTADNGFRESYSATVRQLRAAVPHG
jgi:hypothetical protein